MNWDAVSMKKICIIAVSGAGIMTLLILGTCYWLTGDVIAVICGLLLAGIFLLWGLLLLHVVQQKLLFFSNELCQSIDDMTHGVERVSFSLEKETLLARVCHRLERLYNILQNTRQQAEVERNELQVLLSDLSHQTKTPIANLKMIQDTLLSRVLKPDEQQEFLLASVNQLEKLDFLMQGMIKVSRLEFGVIQLEKKPGQLVDTVATALNGILALAEQKQIQLEVHCPETLQVNHDSRWTAEALFNLLDNAVKYTETAGKISVRAEQWELYVKLSVSDTGRGIPEQEQAAIFQRFYREKAVHSLEGIGIGLYLARKIVTLQGGYIKVDSQVGQGSTFSVFLPLR